MTSPNHQHRFAAPRGAAYSGRHHDVIVVGGGHAGVEAALSAARLGADVALVTPRLDRIGEMSCNPAIGGLGKGQLAREVDALGGIMGSVIDRTGIQFRMLNTRKGYAVRAPRAQADRHLYREEVTRLVNAHSGVTVIGEAADGLLIDDISDADRNKVFGVLLSDGRRLLAPAVVITTGTFLSAIMHTGEEQAEGGRVGEKAFAGISADLARLGLELGRLKTGTPPRLEHEGIDWDCLEEQRGDENPQAFSFATEAAGTHFPALPQVACHITYTNAGTHDLIRQNIHLAPMYAGRIQGQGPRYCPSVEDKVMRFPDRERHQIFLEPEGLNTSVIYANGISTSLPAETQEQFVHSVVGLERARFIRHGYAVEYDFVMPAQLDPSLAVSRVEGLFLAGQINGTSGYEEAAAQGLMAGANAALWVADRAPFVLGRDQAYIGVLIDDLIVSQPTEPYRMFSSRAEYRLMLRQDNADERLIPSARELGLVDAAAHELMLQRRAGKDQALKLLASIRKTDASGTHRPLAEWLRRPEVTLTDLEAEAPPLKELNLTPSQRVGVEAEIKYEGYVDRQRKDVERLRKQESLLIPDDVDFAGMTGLSGEAAEKLARLRPRTLGAATRIAGVNPPDISLLAVHLERRRRSEHSELAK
ncbi:MAG: tRNA uridine 5-carboxymethylaminomethyl modification enzyme [Planctomycetota bacterium]|jgi:tRNA uridine 5-carboxymethylaminomethyl modification enzyme